MKHQIEIPDLPEGWEAVAYRLGDPGERYLDAITKSICRLILASSVGVLIVRRKQVVEMPYNIRIPNLPEGWEPDTLTFDKGQVEAMASCLTPEATTCTLSCRIFIRKKHPRRIVLESTGETRKPKAGEYIQNNGNYCLCRKPDRWGNEHEIWQAVEDPK